MKKEIIELYPMKFYPIYKEKIWGGSKLANRLGRPKAPKNNCGESWELSTVPGDVSVIKGGYLGGLPLDKVIRHYGAKLLGKKVHQEYGNNFPLLVKFIDANKDLSIQVHPNDELAQKRHNSLGKTEMWYIMEAEDEAKVIRGFNTTLKHKDYTQLISQKNSLFNREKVEKGDVVFIPAGTVHAIGKGIMLAEIQQCSDVTYRIYDYDRVGDDGRCRELHLEEAADAIDYSNSGSYLKRYQKFGSPSLVNCPYFSTNQVEIEHEVVRDFSQLDSFVIYLMLEGSARIKTKLGELTMQRGEVCLIPACLDHAMLNPSEASRLLEVHC